MPEDEFLRSERCAACGNEFSGTFSLGSGTKYSGKDKVRHWACELVPGYENSGSRCRWLCGVGKRRIVVTA